MVSHLDNENDGISSNVVHDTEVATKPSSLKDDRVRIIMKQDILRTKADRLLEQEECTVETTSCNSSTDFIEADNHSLQKILSTNTHTTHLDKKQITAVIQQLPYDPKQFLLYAACFGSELDEFILAKFTDNCSEVFSSNCELLASYGLLIKCKKETIHKNEDVVDYIWKFPNESIIEASYDMIPVMERNRFHYMIGRTLRQQLKDNEIGQYINVLVDQFLYGIELIKRNKDAGECTMIAKLLLLAGERSVQSSDFDMAFYYLSHSLLLLDDRAWKQEYDLCLNVYNAAAEAAYCIGNLDRAHALVEVLFLHTQLFEHKIQGYVTQIFTFGTMGNFRASIETGIYVLSKLGVKLPIRPSKLCLSIELMQVKRKLKGVFDYSLLNLPSLHDSKMLSVMKILNAMLSYAYINSTNLGVLIGLRMLDLTLTYGQCDMSPIGFIVYGIFLSGRNTDEGYRFGLIGYEMFKRQKVAHWTARVYLLYFGMIHSLKMPLQETVVNLKFAYRTALQKGDVEYAFLCGSLSLYSQFEISTLPDLKAHVEELRQKIRKFHQKHTLSCAGVFTTFLTFLLGEENTDVRHCNRTSIIDNAFRLDNNDVVMKAMLPWIHFDRMVMDYLFGYIEGAYRHAKVLLRYVMKTHSPVVKTKHALVVLYVGLVAVEHMRRYRTGLKDARKCLTMLEKLAKDAPSNILSKQYLLDAELISVSKDDTIALVKYITAIALAKSSGLLLEQALSNELAAKFTFLKSEKNMAETFYNKAIVHYREWGSEPKVKSLQNEIGIHFLSSSSSSRSLTETSICQE